MIYFFCLLYLFSLSYFFDLKRKKRNIKLHYFIAVIIFVCIAGFRFRMAPDSITYMEDFIYRTNTLNKLSITDFEITRYQPFWILLNSICKSVYNDYFFFQFVVSLIVNLVFFYFIKKTTTKVFTSLLFYGVVSYLYFSMDIIRESLAIGMFLIAILKFDEKKYFMCFLFFLFAILFHVFAVFLGLVFVIISQNISRYFKYTIFSIILLFFILTPNFMETISENVGELMGSQISSYNEVITNKISISGFIYMFLRILPILFCIIKFRKLDEINSLLISKKLILNLAEIYVLLIIIRVFYIPFLERVINYFIFFVIILMTSFLYHLIHDKIKKSHQVVSFFTICIIVFSFNILPMFKFVEEWNSPYYKRYFPYSSIFSKTYDKEREFIIIIEGKEY
jgi:hypothetical protein